MDNPFLLSPDNTSYSTFTKNARETMFSPEERAASAAEPLAENPFLKGEPGAPVPKNPFILKDDSSDVVDKAKLMAEKQVDFVNSPLFDHFQRGAIQDNKHQEEMMNWKEQLGKAFKDTATVKGATSAATSVGNFLSSAIGMPMSWAAAAFSYQDNPHNPDQALHAMETTREWTDLKNLLKFYGVDPEYVDSPNFLDHAMDKINEDILKPGANRYFGDKDSVGKTLYTDIATIALFGATGKAIDKVGGSKPKGPLGNDGIKEADNLKANAAPPPDNTSPAGPVDLTKPEDRGFPSILPEFEAPEAPQGDIDIAKYDTQQGNGPAPAPKDAQRVPFVDKPEYPLRSDLRHPEPSPQVESSGLPIIDEHPDLNPAMQVRTPDVDTKGVMNNPFILNVHDIENAQRGPEVGAHSELELKPEPQEPGLGPDATRSYDDGVAQDIENKRALQGSSEGVKPKTPEEIKAYLDGVLKDQHSEGTTSLDMIKKEFQRLHDFFQANTLEDALKLVVKHGERAEDVLMAKKILKQGGELNAKIPFKPDYDELARGYIGTYPDGSVKVHYHPDHASMTTIVHEAVHAHTNDAIYAYITGKGTKAQMAYGTKLIDLFRLARKELGTEGNERAFQNLNEFNAYGLTDPNFQRALHSIPTKSGNILTRFIDNIKEFFGIGKQQTIFTTLVEMTKDWDKIQTTDPMERYGHAQEVHQGRRDATINYEKIPADENYHETALEAWAASGNKDLHILNPQNFITPNQVAALSKHPLVGFFMDKMGQIVRQVSPRFHQYARDLEPFMFDRATKMERDSLVKSFKALVDLQDPSLKEARAMAETTPGGREALLQKQGLSGREVEFAIKVLDIMKDIHQHDIKSVFRLGRELEYQPMYFPRVHGGRFVLKVVDADGKEQYVKGFDSWTDAQNKASQLKNHLKDTEYKVQDVVQANRNDFGDDFSMLLLEHSIPMEFLENGLKGMEKARETAPWAFEKARRETNVGGYVGEDISGKTEQENLLKVLSWRLQASRNLEMKSRMLADIKFPLFDTAILGEMPRARILIGNLLNRELGVDISGMKTPDRLIQGALETVAKSAAAIKHFEQKYIEGKDTGTFRWDDPMVREDLAKHMARQVTYVTSMFKLALNIPVYATNFAGNGLIGLDGIRMAHLEKVNPGHAMTALWRTWSYFGQEGGARQFMIDARNEGMVESKGQEHYTTAELPDRNTFDRAIQYPRDKIEEFTNYHAIMYYYHFWKAAAPELTGEAFKAKVYQSVKSFTGQYESYAGPIMFDKAGVSGQLMTNFAKWHFNQLGRLLVDIKELKAERDAMPILMTCMMAGIGAGLYGLPGVVEYEGLRRLGQALGAWDMPPVSGLRDKAKKNSIPYPDMVERGAITAGSDSLAQLLGANSGPDISGSMRYSAFFDAPTVAMQTMWQLAAKLIPAGSAELKTIVGGPGATAKQLEDAFKAFPMFTQGIAKRGYDQYLRVGQPLFKEKITGADGSVMWRVKDPSDMGKELYTQSDIEDSYNLLGMKSKREAKNLEGIYYDKWVKRQDEQDIAKYTQGIMSHLGDTGVFQNNVKELVKLGGEQAVNNMLAQLKTEVTQSHFDYFQRQWLDLQKQHDIMAAKKQFERIRSTQRMVEDGSSKPLLNTSKLTDSEDVSAATGAGVADVKLAGQYKNPNANKYPTISAGIPNLRVHEFEGNLGLGGFVRDRDQNDTVFINKGWTDKEKEFAMLHESEHILQKKNTDSHISAVNTTFDRLVGDSGQTRTKMVNDLIDARPYLKSKYGITDSYFDPQMRELQGSKTKNLLYEQFASLAAAEHMQGVSADLTKDPELRKTVFDTAAKREAFRAMTGLRQTRLDSKDLPPYTRVTEKEEPTLPSFLQRLLQRGR